MYVYYIITEDPKSYNQFYNGFLFILQSQFYTILNLPLPEKLNELTRIIDQSSPNKELQTLFPQLINNIFASSFSNGWGLKAVTFDVNRYEFEALTSFFEPQGPMLRLCYKLLTDPQLKYNLPLSSLPVILFIHYYYVHIFLTTNAKVSLESF